MSSRWTHLVCVACWEDLHGDSKTPVSLKDAEEGNCCVCGESTTSGIYFRQKPETLLCTGQLGIHEETK